MKRLLSFLSCAIIASTSFAQPRLVKDIFPGSGSANISELTYMNGWTYFTAYDDVHGLELWKSDGIEGGTVLVKDINPGINSSVPENLRAINGVLYFSANDGIHGYELWQSDGTTAGTQMVKDVNPGAEGSDPTGFTEFNGMVFFSANDGAHDFELWKTDGTAAGTSLVKDIWSGFAGSYPMYFTKAGNTLFFRATHPLYDYELWKTDGTEAGTQLVKDIYPGSPGASLPNGLTAFNNMLFFIADNGVNGRELWKSDGTEAGTQMVKDVNPDFANPYTNELYIFNNLLYFTSSDGVNGYELWISDGTATGTQMLKDVNPGKGDSYPAYFTEMNGELFFTANHDLYEYELWKTDGTRFGTKLVKDINPGTGRGNPIELTEINGALFFSANDGDYDYELWMSNGTGLGTRRVADIFPGPQTSNPLDFLKAGDKLFFIAEDAAHGRELWVFESLQEKVTGFTLMNAVSNQALFDVQDDAVINLAALASNKLNIRANVNSSSGIGSVVFELNGVPFRTENIAPFALAGDNPPGNYHAWTPTPGHYELCAIPYSGSNRKGNMGTPACIRFTVVDVSFGVTHFTLVNAETNEDILNFFDEDNWEDEDVVVFDLTGLPHPERINIRVNTYPPVVGAVGFGFDGDDYGHNEYAAPYALFGDNNGNYRAWQDVLPRAMGGSCGSTGYHHCAVWVWADRNNPEAGEYSTFFRFRLKYDDIRVTSLTLVNAVTNQDIANISDGDVIDLSSLPTDRLNIRANTEPATVGSVVFNWNQIENVAPYALYGDRNGNYHQWIAQPGSYHIEAIPFSRSQTGRGDYKGVCGIPLAVSFEMIQSGASNKYDFEASESLMEDAVLQAYPNPNQGVFNIQLSLNEMTDVSVEIFDLFGKIIFSEELRSFSGKYQRQVDLSAYAQGVYFLRVKARERITVKKIAISY